MEKKRKAEEDRERDGDENRRVCGVERLGVFGVLFFRLSFIWSRRCCMHRALPWVGSDVSIVIEGSEGESIPQGARAREREEHLHSESS